MEDLLGRAPREQRQTHAAHQAIPARPHLVEHLAVRVPGYRPDRPHSDGKTVHAHIHNVRRTWDGCYHCEDGFMQLVSLGI